MSEPEIGSGAWLLALRESVGMVELITDFAQSGESVIDSGDVPPLRMVIAAAKLYLDMQLATPPASAERELDEQGANGLPAPSGDMATALPASDHSQGNGAAAPAQSGDLPRSTDSVAATTPPASAERDAVDAAVLIAADDWYDDKDGSGWTDGKLMTAIRKRRDCAAEAR